MAFPFKEEKNGKNPVLIGPQTFWNPTGQPLWRLPAWGWGGVPWLAFYSALRRALQLVTALEGPLLESSSFSIASLATSEVDFGKYVLLGGCIAFSACWLPVDGWSFRVARGLKVSNNHRIFKARVLFLAVWLSNSVVSFQFHLPGTTPIVFSRLGS